MKKRSVAYPSKNLIEIEKFIISVFENVGETTLKYSDLAKHGNVPVRDGDLFASTANQYGWLNKVRGEGFSPKSAISKALRTPKDDDEKKGLYLEAFKSPSIYRQIINHWNGKKITEEGLKIYLIRDQEFTDGGAKTATKVFLQNAALLGLLDNEGVLNIEGEITIDPTTIRENTKKSEASASTKKKVSSEKPKEKHTENLSFSTNVSSGSVRKISIFVRGQELLLPVLSDMNQADWDAVIKQLQNIKSFSK